jgi:hypothetical protein
MPHPFSPGFLTYAQSILAALGYTPGGGGGTFQTITDAGNITTNSVVFNYTGTGSDISVIDGTRFTKIVPSTISIGDTSDTGQLILDANGDPAISFQNIGSGYQGGIVAATMSANYIWTLPPKTGTFAMLDDVTGGTLQSVTDADSTTTNNMSVQGGGFIANLASNTLSFSDQSTGYGLALQQIAGIPQIRFTTNFNGDLKLATLTAPRVYTLPDKDITIAGLSDIPSVTGYVPYTGATSNVVLGIRSITASNLSGTNTGDQTITLTGNVTGSGTGSFVTTIAANAVTYAKMQAVSTTSRLLGSSSTTTAVQEITLGTGLSMSGTTINVSVTPVITIGVTLSGNGGTISAGSKGYMFMPRAGTITSWTIVGDVTGSIIIDVKRSTYAAFPTTTSIAGSTLPTVTSAQKNTSSTLTGWSTSLATGDIIEFVVNSNTAFTKITLSITVA